MDKLTAQWLAIMCPGIWCLLSGCASLGGAPSVKVVAVWECPPLGPLESEEEGKGVYPPPWRSAAIVCNFDQIGGGQKYVGSLYEGTLFLVASRKYDPRRPLENLGATTRLAVPCSTADLRGHWLTVRKGRVPVFVLVYNCKGTAVLC